MLAFVTQKGAYRGWSRVILQVQMAEMLGSLYLSKAAPRTYAAWREVASGLFVVLGMVNPATWDVYLHFLQQEGVWQRDGLLGVLGFWTVLVFGSMAAMLMLVALAWPKRFMWQVVAQAGIMGWAIYVWFRSDVCEGGLIQHPASQQQLRCFHQVMRVCGTLFALPSAGLQDVPVGAQCRGVLVVVQFMLGFVMPVAVSAASDWGAYQEFARQQQLQQQAHRVQQRLRQGQRVTLSSGDSVGYAESCCRHVALALVSLLLTCTVWDIVMKLTVETYTQQSYFYHQLACFLRPFAASPNASVYTPALRDPSLNGQLRKRLAGDCEQFECRGRNNTFCCAMGKGAWCLPLLGGARVCHVRANRLEQFLDRVLPHFGLLGAKRRDYVVLNAGLWHGLKDDNYINRVKQVVRHYVQHRDRLPTFIWRDVSPQHFMIGGATGEYPDSVPGARSTLATINMTCGPTEGVQLRSDGTLLGDNLEVLQGGQRNALVAPIIRQAGVSYLGIWNHSVPLHFMHKAGECTHFCSPGPYSVWIWRLWRLLAELPRRS
ncbi:hypothetical protein N2152v2_000768 [Parachlorella kessleri]